MELFRSKPKVGNILWYFCRIPEVLGGKIIGPSPCMITRLWEGGQVTVAGWQANGTHFVAHGRDLVIGEPTEDQKMVGWCEWPK